MGCVRVRVFLIAIEMRTAKAAAEWTEDRELDLLLGEIPQVTSPQGRQRGVGVIGDGNGVHGASGCDGYASPMRLGGRRVHCPPGGDGYDAQRHAKDAYYDMVLNRRENGAPLRGGGGGGDAEGVGFPAPSPVPGPFIGSVVPPPLALGVDYPEQQLVVNQLQSLRIGDAQAALLRQGPAPVMSTAPIEVPAAHGAYHGYNFAASGSSIRHEHVFLDQAKADGYVAARPHRLVSDVGLDNFGVFPRTLDTSTGIGWGQGFVQPDFAQSYLLSSQAGNAYGGVPVADDGFVRGRNQFEAFHPDSSPTEAGAEFFSSNPAALDFRGGPKRHYAYGAIPVAEVYHCENSLMFGGKNMNFLECERKRSFRRVNNRAPELGNLRTLRFDDVVRVKEGSIYYHMAKDKNGCRYLQDKFLEGKHHVDAIFEGIINHIADLMISSAGNYLVQEMVEVCDEGQRLRIILALTQDPVKMIAISLNTHG